MKEIFTLLPAVLLFFLQGIQAQVKKRQPADAISNTSISKDSVLIYLRAKADSFLQLYKCCDASKNSLACKDYPAFLITKNTKRNPIRAVLPNRSDAAFVPVFNTVIVNNDNSINTGSAGAVVQDNNAAVVSANYACKRTGLRHFQFFNVGVSAETNGNIWDLYSAGSWRSGILATVGLTHAGGKKGLYFYPEACEKLFYKRRLFLNSLLAQYKIKLETEAERKTRIQEIEKQLGVNESSDSVVSIYQLSLVTDLPEQVEQLQLELDSLKAVQQEVDHLSSRFAWSKGYDSVMQNEITRFDSKHVPALSGYHTWWYNLKVSVGNTRNKLYDDTLSADSRVMYHLSDYARVKISWDGNWMWSKKSALWFLKGEALLYNRNFLQNKTMSDLPYIEKDATGKKYVYSLDNTTRYGRLGSLSNLNKNIWVVYPSVYGAGFFAHGKCIGVEASAGYKFNLTKLQDVPDPNTYTMYGGLILRVKKDKAFSKATISVNVGFYEAKKGRRAPDDFAFRLKVGIPFSSIPKNG